MPVVEQGLPNATIAHRPGEINAFDNAEFKAAVKKFGRKKLLIAGISTEVCVAFCSLSALAEGYEVYPVHGQEHAKLMGDHLPFAGNLFASFAAATGHK